MTKPMWPMFGNALRGGLIGTAEAVPGVSGGTIALVVGVYDTLIDTAGYIASAVKALATGKPSVAAQRLREIKWSVVAPLLVGMAVFLVLAAKLLAPALETYPRHTHAVFFGMILVSIAIPLRTMRRGLRKLDVVLIIAGAIAAAILSGLPPAEIDDPSLWLVALSAAIAINALVLPGLSGSFMLLTMGLYTSTIGAVNDRDLAYLGVFAIGAGFGLGTFVKGLQWLLHHKHQATLAVMTGLMIGSLRVLWPWQSEETRQLQSPGADVVALSLLAVLGGAIVAAMIIVEIRVSAKATSPTEQPRSHGDGVYGSRNT